MPPRMATPAAGPVAELSVLKPVDAAIKSEEDYEIFMLRDATVYWQSTGKITSLLNAFADAPLRVQGRLEPVRRNQRKFLVNPKATGAVDIEITDVTEYSYGEESSNGTSTTTLWVRGRAGWFEISPSPAYSETFREMLEAVGIMYFITDVYSKQTKKGGGPSARLVFQEYAEDARYPCDNVDEAQKIFYSHREFLILQFLSKAGNRVWSHTSLFQEMRRQFPKDFEIAKARVEGRAVAGPQRGKYTLDEPPAHKSTRRTKSKPDRKTQDAPKKDANWWEAAALFAFIRKAVNRGAMQAGHIAIDKVARLLVKRYEIDDQETARHVIIAHAQNLQYMMDHPKRKSGPSFTGEPIYAELSADHSLPAADIRRALMVELRPRNDHAIINSDMDTDPDSSSSLETPKRQPRHRKLGTLSVLRPKSSKFSGKGTGSKPIKGKGKGKGKAPTIDVPSDEDGQDDDSAAQSASDSEMDVDTPTHALLPGKRKQVDEPSTTVPRKRAASTISDSDAPSPSSSVSQDSASNAEPLPLKWPSRNRTTLKTASMPPVLPAIVKTQLPQFAANAPGDSWICTFDGCSQKIYGASTELGHDLIEEHLKDHAGGRVGVVGLVLKEEQRLRLPVNNLIKRIREMSERQQPLFPSDNSVSTRPNPIERMV